jgi:hypothetical protein
MQDWFAQIPRFVRGRYRDIVTIRQRVEFGKVPHMGSELGYAFAPV